MDIARWLKSIRLDQYIDLFQEHRIDDSILASLTNEDLKDIGCLVLGDRKKLLRAIDEYREEKNELPEKTIFARRYHVDKKIDSGGRADIYRAFDSKLNHQPIVLKVLKKKLRHKASAIEKMKKEALISRTLASEYTCKLFDYEDVDDEPLLVMEYIDGESLFDYRYHYKAQGKRIPLEKVQEWLPEITKGLAYIHENKVLHLDIKPGNLLLTKENRIKIVDFGYSEMMEHREGKWIVPLCRGGTFSYSSPEQNLDLEMDWRSDLYSLSATLYKILDGDYPFKDEVLKKGELDDAFKPIAGMPEWVNSTLKRALKTKKEDRFESLAQFEKAFSGK